LDLTDGSEKLKAFKKEKMKITQLVLVQPQAEVKPSAASVFIFGTRRGNWSPMFKCG